MRNQEASIDRAVHAIADSTRRRILGTLKQRGARSGVSPSGHRSQGFAEEKCSGLCAGDIEERVKLSQPTISHHMAILTKAGLVEVVKQGQWRWYRRNEKAIQKVIQGLRAKI